MFPLPHFPAGLWQDNTRLMDAFVLCEMGWAAWLPSVHIPAPGHDTQPGSARRVPRSKLQTGRTQTAAPGLGWAGQAEPQQQMHGELCTLTWKMLLLCSRTNPSKHIGSASLETETCATSPLHFPTCILQHTPKSWVENRPSNPAVCAGPLSKGYILSTDYG